jgi:DnaJ family protein C protein 19
MLPSLLLGVLLLIGLMLVARWLANAPPRSVLRGMGGVFVVLVLAAVALLALTGRIGWAVAAFSSLTPWIGRLIRLHGMWKMISGFFSTPSASNNGNREETRSSPPAQRGKMSREEALSVLGLKPGASEKDIREAHRRLITRVHPDVGGSDDLAARINAARDVLLG